MPTGAVAALWALQVAVGLLLAVHGALYLALALRRARLPPPRDPEAPALASPPPFVTVQVCVRNEGPLVEQALAHAAALDWPRDRLELHLLDDSDDGSQAANAAAVARLRAKGIDAVHLHRAARTGFKAGALQAGLARSKGTVLVPLDTDFTPAPGLLRRLVPHLAPGVACVQARWGSRNEAANLLTRAQGLAMDGHFIVEQRVRAEAGTLMSFNATACAWSRAHVKAAGGWPAATLAEDLDLAARAHLAGARFVYLEATAVPALLPERTRAFALQQARWARGSLQNARLHSGAVLRARLTPAQKAGTLHHLWHYSIHPLILLLVASQAALAALGATGPAWLLWLAWGLPAASAIGPLAMYAVASGSCTAPAASGAWRACSPSRSWASASRLASPPLQPPASSRAAPAPSSAPARGAAAGGPTSPPSPAHSWWPRGRWRRPAGRTRSASACWPSAPPASPRRFGPR